MKFSILGHCGSREWLRTISYSSYNLLSIWTFSLLQNILKGKWNKQITIAFVEFGLEFNLEKIIWNKLASFSKINIDIISLWKKLTQCKRRVWRKADNPSIKHKMLTVRTAQKLKTTHKMTPPYLKNNQKIFRTRKFGI